ncbi:MAG: hypothetical protein HY958_04670 [Bacteroidia bacterium]|nr:hypothetical protein [Bacteroidia bacterium]
MSDLIFRKENLDFRDFIGYENTVYKYLHNTPNEDIASAIISEGFKFVNNLDKTTDQVSNTNVEEINFFFCKRKYYGRFTVVIHLGIDLVKFYLNQCISKNILFQELLFSRKENEKNENEEHFYTLHRQFIKGYYNHIGKEAVCSPFYNPLRDLPDFAENMKTLLLRIV